MTALFDEVQALRAELEAVKAERDGWRDASFLSDCEARSGQLEEMTVRAESAEARAAQLEAENGRLREELRSLDDGGFTAGESHGKALAEAELARLKDRVAGWDIDATADSIARNLSAVKGGRYHATAYSAAKAAAIEALKLAQANLTTDNPGGDTAREAFHD